ncbi:MAG: hypothetical protein LKJ92_05940 [Ruminococcus sp.]|jgi:putative membrane protein|nr:hypothetical protein [Ruminococcus sp.]
MKNKNKIIAIALLASFSLSALGTPIASAAEKSTPKEEVVYVNLNDNGSVKDVEVVNIFNTDKAGTVTDYGNYSSVRNMNTTDKISYSNGKTTIDASKGRIYYEGKQKDTTIPWDISIGYFLDGKEYSADEVAGKSGKLKIKIKITDNKDSDDNFYDGFALQTSVTLDTDKCSNITASGATEANVGSDKQFTYTTMPSKGADIEITADVKNFEMAGISINAVPLSLEIDVDDKELTDKVSEMTDAITKIDDGAKSVNDGAGELKDSVKGELKDGTNSLKIGAESLDSGISSLDTGIKTVENGLKQLNEKSGTLTGGSAQIKNSLITIQSALNGVSLSTDKLAELSSASSQIKSGISQITSGIEQLEQNTSFQAYEAVMAQNGLDVESLRQSNAATAENITLIITSLQSQVETLKQAGFDTTELETQLAGLSQVAQLLYANNLCIDGTETYLNQINSSIDELLAGAKNLEAKYEEFDSAINELVDTVGNLSYNVSVLADAINLLVESYGQFDSGLNEYTDGVATIVSGFNKISSGCITLTNGSKELYSGAKLLDDNTSLVVDGAEELQSGTGKLKDGTKELSDKTDGLDTEISDKIDEMIDSMTGSDVELKSFASEKNTSVNSVQFVIKTDDIKVEEPEEPKAENKEELSFWQKLFKLFGIE